MALLEVVLNQTFFNQKCVNRFTYEASGTPAAVSLSFALASALGAVYDLTAIPPAYPPGTLIADLAALQSNDVIFNSLSAKNIYSVTDFYDTPFVPSLTGADTAQALSPIMAYGWRSNRVRTDVARGTKRFVGVTETFNTEGGVVAPGSTVIINMTARLSETLSYDDEGNMLTFVPVVCGKEKYPVMKDGEPTGTFAYRYYETLAEQMEHTAVGVTWQAYDTLRGQASRQYGKGS